MWILAPGSPRSSEFDHTSPPFACPVTVDQSSGPVEAPYPLPGLHARRAGGQRNFALESATDEVVHAIGMHPLNSVCVARRSASRHPCTRESGRQSETLPRQRMDFLLLAPDYSRIVLRSTGFNTAAGRTGPTRGVGHANRGAAHVGGDGRQEPPTQARRVRGLLHHPPYTTPEGDTVTRGPALARQVAALPRPRWVSQAWYSAGWDHQGQGAKVGVFCDGGVEPGRADGVRQDGRSAGAPLVRRVRVRRWFTGAAGTKPSASRPRTGPGADLLPVKYHLNGSPTTAHTHVKHAWTVHQGSSAQPATCWPRPTRHQHPARPFRDLGAPMLFSRVTFAAARPILPTAGIPTTPHPTVRRT
jgi:hypothetical protein